MEKSNVVRRVAVLAGVIIGGPAIFFLLRYLAFPSWGETELNIGFVVWVVAIFVADRWLSKLRKSN